jgi:uncharacterized protein (DUF952 family)
MLRARSRSSALFGTRWGECTEGGTLQRGAAPPGAVTLARVATTYHLVPRATWEAADPAAPYAPESLSSEGFVHCTDGPDEVALTANRYFRAEADDLLALLIDVGRLSAPVRYEDPRRVYPHVYGPIEREAILGVLEMPRAADGSFLPPPPR